MRVGSIDADARVPAPPQLGGSRSLEVLRGGARNVQAGAGFGASGRPGGRATGWAQLPPGEVSRLLS